MRVALTTFNASYIHRNLALRWLYVVRPPKVETTIFEFVIKDDPESCAKNILEYQPDVVAISVYIWNGTIVKEFVRLLKMMNPTIRIILGGPEVSFSAASYLTDDVEAIMRGEGEQTFWPYVTTGQLTDGLYRHDYQSPKAYPLTDLTYLEQFEDPYFLPFDQPTMINHYLYLETSRGCPYSCSYCLASTDHSNRTFSLPYLIKVLSKLKEFGPKQVKFLDRTFNAASQRVEKINEVLLDLPADISFQFEVVAEQLDEKIVQQWCGDPNPGRWRLEAGIQSFEPQALKAVSRIQNSSLLTERIKRLVAGGLTVHADLIAGLPYQNLSSFAKTYCQAMQLNTAELQVGTLKLLAGTVMNQQKQNYGIVHQAQPPYEIISNNWLSASDLQQVRWVALATERLYNRKMMRRLIEYLAVNESRLFERMADWGQKMAALPHPYQPWQVFKTIRPSLENQTEIGLMEMDYFALFRRRPPRYEPYPGGKDEKSATVSALIDQGIISEADRRHAMVATGWFENQLVTQILIYHDDRYYPQRYFIDAQYRYVGREDLND